MRATLILRVSFVEAAVSRQIGCTVTSTPKPMLKLPFSAIMSSFPSSIRYNMGKSCLSGFSPIHLCSQKLVECPSPTLFLMQQHFACQNSICLATIMTIQSTLAVSKAHSGSPHILFSAAPPTKHPFCRRNLQHHLANRLSLNDLNLIKIKFKMHHLCFKFCSLNINLST